MGQPRRQHGDHVSAPLVWLVTAIYLAVALNEGLKGSPGWCMTYIGYAFANIGIIVAMKGAQ